MSDDEFALLEEQRCSMRDRYQSLEKKYLECTRGNAIAKAVYQDLGKLYLDISHNDLTLQPYAACIFRSKLQFYRNYLDVLEESLLNIAFQLHRLEMFINGSTIFSVQQFSITELKIQDLMKSLFYTLTKTVEYVEKYFPGIATWSE